MGPKLYASFENERTDRNARWFAIFGRLKPGISIRTAAQEVEAVAKGLEKLFPATNRGFSATVTTEREFRLISLPVLGGLVAALFTLALVILSIACANVANLMLGRGRAREREIGVRLAIGASRARLLRLLLLESFLIAIASGALSLVAARISLSVLSNVEIPSDLPFQLRFQIDERVLWFTAIVSGASAFLFGLLPAIQSTRPDLISIMKGGESEQRRKHGIGSYALVVVQIAGTMILLVLTTQVRRNFANVLSSNPGFRVGHRITMRFNPEASGYDLEGTRQFYERLVERASAVTGIKCATITSGLPLTYDPARIHVTPEGYEFPPGSESVQVLSYVVDEHYFDTFAVPIIAGRGFRAADRADSKRIALVNEAFANKYLGANPLGKRMRFRKDDSNRGLQEESVEVVGVTVTGKTFLLMEPPAEVVYLPFRQNFHDRMTLVAETSGDPAAMAGPLQAVVQSIDPNVSAFRVRTMEDIFEHGSTSLVRSVARIYDMAAGMGLVMALVGLYAVVSYQVARRTREIGIRMALGAKRMRVVLIFLKQALTMSVIGVSIGMILSLFASPLTETAIGVGKLEPLIVASVSVALLLTTLIASLIPARRAAQIDPQQALRWD
jgi:predicted permease